MCPLPAEFFHADRQADMTELIVTFRIFANAPEKPRFSDHLCCSVFGFLIIRFIEQANSRSVGQILQVLWNPQFCCHVLKGPRYLSLSWATLIQHTLFTPRFFNPLRSSQWYILLHGVGIPFRYLKGQARLLEQGFGFLIRGCYL